MPCGILLYGYPGTGKTLLGLSMPSVVSNAKFIHIKVKLTFKMISNALNANDYYQFIISFNPYFLLL